MREPQHSTRKFILTTGVPALLVALLGILVVLLVQPEFKQIEKRAPDPSPVSAVVPQSPTAVAEAIERAFRGGVILFEGGGSIDPVTSRFLRFHAAAFDDPLFPDDFQLKARSTQDAELRTYAALPASARRLDFYLSEPTGDYYWPSEYSYRAQPAQFRASFIVHLEPQQPAGTKIEVLEYGPTIWVGEKFGWSAHTGPVPGFFHDIRVVAPTTADRKEVLKKIQQAVARATAPAKK